MPWVPLGSGTFNWAYTDSSSETERTLVLKIQKPISHGPKNADRPDRAVRLWNLINPDVVPPAEMVRVESSDFDRYHLSDHRSPSGAFVDAWTCPYVRGEQASADEISEAVVRIFNRTGRIVIDAISPRNFLRTPSGNIVCVDIGMALELERREAAPDSPPHSPPLKRLKSDISLESWDAIQEPYIPYFLESRITNPEIVSTLQALLFLKLNRPDIHNADFLNTDADLRHQLADAYVVQRGHLSEGEPRPAKVESALNSLDHRMAASTKAGAGSGAGDDVEVDALNGLKKYCQLVLNVYVQAAKMSDKEFTAFPPIKAKELLSSIQAASSIEQIERLIDALPASTIEELETTRHKCKLACDEACRMDGEHSDSDDSTPGM
jgi:hypothetical protein